MGIDAIVVRHSSAGVPAQHRRSGPTPSVINAGDGWHEHPTQALLDCYTIRQHRIGSLGGQHIAIVGDIKHCRVARSDVLAFTALGAEVTLVAPPTLLPPTPRGVAGRRRATTSTRSCPTLDVGLPAAHAAASA